MPLYVNSKSFAQTLVVASYPTITILSLDKLRNALLLRLVKVKVCFILLRDESKLIAIFCPLTFIIFPYFTLIFKFLYLMLMNY